MPTPLDDILIEQISKNGPISFHRFMDLALTHPDHGYYKTRNAIGAEGDFITAPEISQMFGELCGLWGLNQLITQNITATAGWAELGAGRGTLMADIIRTCSSALPEKTDKWPVHLLDVNEALIAEQKTKLSDSSDLHHHTTLTTLPAIPLLFIANEFFDALPIRQFVASKGRWFERHVDLEKGKLALKISDTPESDIDLPPPPSDGQVAEYAPELPAIVKILAEHINQHGGGGLIIDYGKDNATGDTVQAVMEHKPVDILESPGLCDISAWVDFSAIRKAATATGAKSFGPHPQGAFLKQLGLYQRAEQLAVGEEAEGRRKIVAAVDRLSSPAQMGNLFKVMAILPSNHPIKDCADLPGFAPASKFA